MDNATKMIIKRFTQILVWVECYFESFNDFFLLYPAKLSNIGVWPGHKFFKQIKSERSYLNRILKKSSLMDQQWTDKNICF